MVKFKFADIGEGLTEGKVASILVKVGDKVKDGQEMFEVETDKVNAEIYSPCDGIITKINMKVGDTIFVGDVVVEIDDGKGDAPVAEPAPAAKPQAQETNATPPVEANEDKAAGVVGAVPVSNTLLPSRNLPTTNAAQATNNGNILSTPLVRKMAADLKVDLQKINGSGPNGRIMRADLETFMAAGGTTATANNSKSINTGPSIGMGKIEIPTIHTTGSTRRQAMTPIRKAIAKQMVLSKTVIPETTLFKTVNVTKLIEIRTQLKAQAESQGVKLTYMPFFMKACAIALKDFPILNTSYDQNTEEIVFKEYYNIGMATDTPTGLMVPVVKGVDQMNVLQIGATINDLAIRTRDRKIKGDEMKDGTFTITNFGSAGIEFATPVINFPEAAILGVGTIEKKPFVNENNEIEIASMLPLSLAVDHRLIDGADGGRFLMRVKELLESPALLLL